MNARPLEWRVKQLENDVADLHTRLEHPDRPTAGPPVEQHPASPPTHRGGAATPAAPAGQPWSLWDVPPAERPARLAGLDGWVCWVNTTYGTATAGRHIPDCWADHPGLTAELLTLHHTWRAAFLHAAQPDPAQDWHDSRLPGLWQRLGDYTHRDCLTGTHQPHRTAPGRPAHRADPPTASGQHRS